ncbi:LOG family protein [Aspergillus clavatus NRRL 1]|uniref:Lysine decarboxylase, putative n=1 Tax=Aspergillus clavatus (strain ATCC 1007 / CBS 513.65 / DSM 816 / NCTC 3887 / NRRL 1 / QM 1276 / 107) TaxID=344612 RepID=A1CM54_ASPCL|nr:lysine decarboxylase, putative [Aspergillus clavatus NRRL 1]EAW08641.1 lysine decarboxylase, putative [Aspergillus clavatus NRRL 1]
MTAAQQDKPAVVCVFCGSVAGTDPVHMETARALAREFHKNNVQLVYGGGTKGLMGELARTLVSLSGPQAVHGVIPRALVRVEPGYDNTRQEEQPTESSGKGAERVMKEPLDQASLLKESDYGITTIVPDMHTRKRLMATKVREGGPGSGFVSLAGGFGTIEEVMEMTTWSQLGIHRLGIVLLNVNGYWDGLLSWVQTAVKEGYIGAANADILIAVKDPREVLPKLLEYKSTNGRMDLDWGEE